LALPQYFQLTSSIEQKKMMWRRVAIGSMACALANCEGDQISQPDVMGEFHADVPSGRATLVIKPDYTWEYHIDGSRDFIRSGKWEPEPSLTASSIYTVTFIRFEFGFRLFEPVGPLSEHDLQKPGFWPAQFSKDYTGKARACIRDGEICFKHS
jgi:hypothetical protein